MKCFSVFSPATDLEKKNEAASRPSSWHIWEIVWAIEDFPTLLGPYIHNIPQSLLTSWSQLLVILRIAVRVRGWHLGSYLRPES
jgi:hypothetical protein